MRKVTAGLFHSIDGAVEAPDQWQFDQFDDELGALLTRTLSGTTDVVLGRKGYEEWAGFWPTAEFDDDFKTFINAVPKHVATRTLKGLLAWQNSAVIDGDLEGFVRGLKQADLLPVFKSSGYASDVISGRRAISKACARKLAAFFGVSVELFI